MLAESSCLSELILYLDCFPSKTTPSILSRKSKFRSMGEEEVIFVVSFLRLIVGFQFIFGWEFRRLEGDRLGKGMGDLGLMEPQETLLSRFLGM